MKNAKKYRFFFCQKYCQNVIVFTAKMAVKYFGTVFGIYEAAIFEKKAYRCDLE